MSTSITTRRPRHSSLSHFVARRRDLLALAALAVCVRLVFLLLTADTFDYDEFVLLLLARDTAHGATPYRDFMFFHPPGALVFLAALQPLTHLWWPLARVLVALVDSVTAVLVMTIGTSIFARREALAAGVLYALSPLALIAGTRVGQDPIVTFCGVAGILVLVRTTSMSGAAIGGVLLGIAIWTKYPAIYFLPIYLLASRRRAIVVLVSTLLTLAVLFLPFHAEWRQLYDQTIQFQRTRWSMDATTRLQTTVLFWLAVNPFAVLGAFLRRDPLWLWIGFVVGGGFVFSSQVYYHYFVPIVPFAALLGAPLAARMAGQRWRVAVTLGLVVAGAWGVLISRAGSHPLFVTAAHLSDVAPAVTIIQQRTAAGTPVLADQYQYAYLAGRPAVAHYFWNVGVLVNAHYLERRLPKDVAVVVSYGSSSGYPAGFTQYLDAGFNRVKTRSNTVWLPGK